MKECGIEKRVFELELELTESEQMTCGILDRILGEDITDEIIGVIDAAYEAGQDIATESIRSELGEYVSQETVKQHLVDSKLLYSDDPYYEREYRCASCKQESIRNTIRDVWGIDAEFVRIGKKIYLEIGRVGRV